MKKLVKFHLSVDDVFESLNEISDKNIKLKDHWFFSYLYKIYKEYNIRIAIYLFYESKVKNTIRQCSMLHGFCSLCLFIDGVIQKKNSLKLDLHLMFCGL